MCTDEVLNIEETPVVSFDKFVDDPKPISVNDQLNGLLKNESVAELLAAKKVVEGILAERIQQEVDAMRANAAAIAEATRQPIEQIVESLMPKAGRSARKLAVVEAPKPERVKYRHPENSELTWSGRGKQPGWLKDALQEYDEQDLLAA